MPMLSQALMLLLSIMALLWLASLVVKDVSIVDRFWGLFFVVLAVFYGANAGFDARYGFVVCLVCIWGCRLSWHIHRRSRGHGEDVREFVT